jgi:hypothetical protein
MVGDLNAKHVDWNLWLSTRLGNLLLDYADKNSCWIFGMDNPITNTYNTLATPDILDIVIIKSLNSPVYCTLCSALSSYHFPVLIKTTCRSYFQHPPDRPDFRSSEWANFQTHLEDQIPFELELHNWMTIQTCVENLCIVVLKALVASTPKRLPRADPWPPILAGILGEIRLRNRLRR